MAIKKRHKQAWVVSADMGYGHDRAAHGIEELSYGGFITANHYIGIPKQDRNLWKETRRAYEAISRLKPIPIIGDFLFEAMDRFQEIPAFYPRRDLSKPSIQLRMSYKLIERGLMKHLVNKLIAKRKLPVICTFPLTALAMEYHGYPEDIYTIVTDTDMARAWVPPDPKRSKIQYFAPTGRVVERLKLYGVHPDRIHYTGFPIPKKLIGGADAKVLKTDLAQRICNLDPTGAFTKRYWRTLEAEFGSTVCNAKKKSRPVTITFTVGGAGAQRQLAIQIAKSLREKLAKGIFKLVLVAGTHKQIARYFQFHLRFNGLGALINKGIEIYYEPERHAYFKGFDAILRRTDILWTKPSELSFYTGLGLPIIMSPPIGSQEEFNRLWLQNVGGGIQMANAETCNEWIQDWINSGALARMAWNGYVEAPTHGAHRIEAVITGEDGVLEPPPLIV